MISLSSFSALGQNDSLKKFRFMPLPSVFHTPETSWGFGATLLGFYQPQDTLTKKSNAQLFLDATLRRQVSFLSDFNIYTPQNKYYITGSSDLSKFPEFFFGIGNQNEKNDHCLIKIKYLDVKTTVYRNVYKDWYVGASVHHQNLLQIDKAITQDGIILDNMGYSSTGAGLGFLIDNRDNLLNQKKDTILKLRFLNISTVHILQMDS